jgi:hypothetical protein
MLSNNILSCGPRINGSITIRERAYASLGWEVVGIKHYTSDFSVRHPKRLSKRASG